MNPHVVNRRRARAALGLLMISFGSCVGQGHEIHVVAGGAAAAAIAGGRIIISEVMTPGVSEVIISGTGDLQRVRFPETVEIGDVWDLAADNGTLLAAVDGGIAVLEVHGAEPVQLLGALRHEVLRGHSTVVTLSDRIGAVSHSRAQPEGSDSVGISLIDLTNPAEPRLFSTIHLPLGSDNVAQMTIRDSIVFVAAGSSGLLQFDIDDPSAARLLSQYEPGSWSRGVAVSGSLAYLAVSMTQGASSVHTLDISVASEPRLVETTDTPGVVQELAVAGSFLYAADREGGLRMYDIGEGEPGFTALIRLWASAVTAADSLVVTWDDVRGSAEIVRHPSS